MDQRVVDAFRRSVAASTRAARFQLFYAVVLAALAGYFFLDDKPMAALIQCVCSGLSLLIAQRFFSAAKKLKPLIDGIAEQ